MFISKKFSSAIMYSACSAALLTMVGCSDAGTQESGPSAQTQNPVTAAEPQNAEANNSEQQSTPTTQDASTPADATAGQSAPTTQDGSTPADAASGQNPTTAPNAQPASDFSGTTRGRVSQVNADGSIVVLGQTIVVVTSTVFFGVSSGEIMVGDYVSVQSTVNGSGQIVAGAITLDTSFDSQVSLVGVVVSVDFENETFQVGGITVEFDAVDFDGFDSANLTVGMVVEIVADEDNFEPTSVQIEANSITVLGNGSTVSISSNGITVSDEDGTVIIDDGGIFVIDEDGAVVIEDSGVFVNDEGETVFVNENGVLVYGDGTAVINSDGVSVEDGGESVIVGPNGVFVNDEGETIVIDENGVTITDSDGTTGVTTDGITIDGVDLEDMIMDTINDTLEEVLDLGDLSMYEYTDIQLSVSSNCLSVGVPVTFQVTGDTSTSAAQLVTHNLSGQVTVNTDSSGHLSVLASDSTGIHLNMSEQDIAQLQIVAGDTTLTHYVGAISDDVERPVVLAKQTENWCSFIVFEQDNCTSITNPVSSTSVNAGQTIVDTSPSGTSISIDGEVLVDTESAQWVFENGTQDSVSIPSGLSVNGCTLDNPENIPVLVVE